MFSYLQASELAGNLLFVIDMSIQFNHVFNNEKLDMHCYQIFNTVISGADNYFTSTSHCDFICKWS